MTIATLPIYLRPMVPRQARRAPLSRTGACNAARLERGGVGLAYDLRHGGDLPQGPLAQRTDSEQTSRDVGATAKYLSVGFDGKSEAVAVGAGKPRFDHSPDQRLIEIGLEAGTREGEVTLHELGRRGTTPQDFQPEALAAPLDLRHRAPQQHGTALVKLAHEPRMHLNRKSMAVRIEERPKMPEEARLLTVWEPLPNVLQR